MPDLGGRLQARQADPRALKLRDWNRAQEIVRRWDVEGEKPTKKAQVTIEELRDQFLEDATTSRHLGDGTLKLYKLLFRQLIACATDQGISLINNMDLDALTKFRATWDVESLTALKMLERLRSIYKFALKRKMVSENYALDLVPPEVEENPTLPFPEDEELRIRKAAISDKVDRWINAFVLTMRYSGLRISDTATLATDSLEGNRLRLHQTETGVFVSVLVPPDVAEALRAVPHKNPKYFFWSGTSKVSSITGSWRKRLAVVFRLAGIKNGHSHRFRDTFAVSLLEAGVSMENVSTLLGHQSIRVTEKHYSPWVKTRQDALDKAVEKAFKS